MYQYYVNFYFIEKYCPGKAQKNSLLLNDFFINIWTPLSLDWVSALFRDYGQIEFGERTVLVHGGVGSGGEIKVAAARRHCIRAQQQRLLHRQGRLHDRDLTTTNLEKYFFFITSIRYSWRLIHCFILNTFFSGLYGMYESKWPKWFQ